jgi:hypothetical protein
LRIDPASRSQRESHTEISLSDDLYRLRIELKEYTTMGANLITPEQTQTAVPVMAPVKRAGTISHRQAEQASQPVTGIGRGRTGWRACLAGLFVVGVFSGVGISDGRIRAEATPITEQALTGAWELTSVAGAPVGPNMPSAVMSQKVTFQNGVVTGVTRLRPGSVAATTAMPFPDASVTQIYTNPTSQEVVVTWDGTYRLLRDGCIEVKLGTRRFRIGARYNPVSRALEMDHDAILTYRGGASYHAVN